MFAPAPDTAAFVSVLRTVTNSARSRLVTFRALTDCVGGCGGGGGVERREEIPSKVLNNIQMCGV